MEKAVAGSGEDELEAIKARHLTLADELGVNGAALLAEHFEALTRLRAGLALTSDASPRLKARIMAQGELMATRLGQAWLAKGGMESIWLDARDHLAALPASGARGYLAVDCQHEADAELQSLCADLPPVIITQGFIARREDGDTALLGRGGSDTSASYFAAKLGAERLEIWTDVPGFFSADPRLTGAARQIRSLAYAEAQELASMGAGVLHPRAISPVRKAGIEMQVLCTHRPGHVRHHDLGNPVRRRAAPQGGFGETGRAPDHVGDRRHVARLRLPGQGLRAFLPPWRVDRSGLDLGNLGHRLAG